MVDVLGHGLVAGPCGAPDAGLRVGVVEEERQDVVPVSGGGLLAGIATAVRGSRPNCRVMGVQPEANGSLARSLAAGERVNVGPVQTLADALVASTPGERTFRIARQLVDQAVLVTEGEIAHAVRELALRQKIVAEPGGAVGVAALLAGKIPGSGDVACVISGGNVMPSVLAGLLADPGTAG